MSSTAKTLPDEQATRWPRLARALDLDPEAPLVVALSGGADSVLLLHVVHVARGSRRGLWAVHVEHGLRGERSLADQAFCVELCRTLGVPLVRRAIELEPDGPSLEARARAARYRVLAEEARRVGASTILTGHHADDVLETMLMRWLRGGELGGLVGPKPVSPLGPDLRLVRPLCGMRRAEVRRLLSDHGLAWCEDETNTDARFTRNRVRHALLPGLERSLGPEALRNLRAFAGAVEALEDSLARATAHLGWTPPCHAVATRAHDTAELGGSLARAELMRLAPPLRRRALWRLVVEGSGHAPARRVLELVLDDLAAGRCTRHALGGGWSLRLRGDALELGPPPTRLAVTPFGGDAPAHAARQLELFDGRDGGQGSRSEGAPRALSLELPGLVHLADGRCIEAARTSAPPTRPVPRGPHVIELDLDLFDTRRALSVRALRPGDRFHPLGAPGSRRISRFLADAGVPHEERSRVPLVFAGGELIWAAGLRPCERLRVTPRTRERLVLTLHGAAPAIAARDASGAGEPLANGAGDDGGLFVEPLGAAAASCGTGGGTGSTSSLARERATAHAGQRARRLG